jgi:hypothetical protein
VAAMTEIGIDRAVGRPKIAVLAPFAIPTS